MSLKRLHIDCEIIVASNKNYDCTFMNLFVLVVFISMKIFVSPQVQTHIKPCYYELFFLHQPSAQYRYKIANVKTIIVSVHNAACVCKQ